MQESRVGAGEQGWRRGAGLVQESRVGAGEQGWCRGAGLVQGSRVGAGEQGWCRGAGLVQGSRVGAGEQGWCRRAGLVQGSRVGAGEQGWCRGAGLVQGSRVGIFMRVLASHQCGPGSTPGLGVICGLSLLLVLYSAPTGFPPGTPVFISSKPTFPNSNSILECTDISE